MIVELFVLQSKEGGVLPLAISLEVQRTGICTRYA